jgi:hypothetical protein
VTLSWPRSICLRLIDDLEPQNDGLQMRLTKLLIATLLACTFCAPYDARASDARGASRNYCSSKIIRNYEAPFRKFPTVAPPPIDKPLPFGPANLELIQIAEPRGRVSVGGGTFGYEFFPRVGIKRRVLGWKVTATLVTLSERGETQRRIRRTRTYLRYASDGATVSLPVPRKAGFYRFSIVFHDNKQRQLAAYGEYLRVMEPVVEAEIATERQSYQRGEVVRARLENRGTEALRYGASFRVELLAGAEWTRVGPARHVWPLYLAELRAGVTGNCMF